MELCIKIISNNKHQQLGNKLAQALIGRSLIKEATELLPQLPLTANLSEINAFIKSNLRFNSETSRTQFQRCLTKYLFPDGETDKSLIAFSKKATNTSLKNVCFYKFCKRYPLTYDLFSELLIPNIANGSLHRRKIINYLQERFPKSGSILHQIFFFLEAITDAGIAKYNSGVLTYSYRHIDTLSFAFILYSEFPRIGMYDISLVEKNSVFTSQLWQAYERLDALYILRDKKLLAKVSEIDNIRQFTTQFSLEEFTAIFG
jgi:DNA repair protein RadC